MIGFLRTVHDVNTLRVVSNSFIVVRDKFIETDGDPEELLKVYADGRIYEEVIDIEIL